MADAAGSPGCPEHHRGLPLVRYAGPRPAGNRLWAENPAHAPGAAVDRTGNPLADRAAERWVCHLDGIRPADCPAAVRTPAGSLRDVLRRGLSPARLQALAGAGLAPGGRRPGPVSGRCRAAPSVE